MVPYCDGDADWYHFPPLCPPSPLALLSAEDYPLPIAAFPPAHLSRGDDELIDGSCHGALAAAADRPSSALMNLSEGESYYDLPIFPPPPAAGDHQFFSNQLPPVPVDSATVGLDDALLQPLGDIDLEAFDNADEHKAPHHGRHTMIVPAGQHAVGQEYAGVDVVDDADEKPMAPHHGRHTMVGQEYAGVDGVIVVDDADQKPMAMVDCFLPGANNAFESAMPPPQPSLPLPARGRRSVDHRSAPAPGGKTRLDHIGFDELRRYFYMPITRAAREMNVGLTVLKKRCRELGIARWPHRKMKSLKSLILSVQEMGTGMNPAAVQQELAALETYCALMEENPAIELTERTKKLRQACFKESYKRRRAAAVNVVDHIFNFDEHQFHHQLPPPPSPSSAERHGSGSFFGY
ncbi:uncharacterized protein LOC101757335 [Setaria italica]|uniref:uncharacterized protein LOC101757335 n=1 Tax=Setaria italica TaxID=4555 RepID=UPI000350BA28|nr:uncharacterized protein LOC101757335 [Setaria italica]XP_034594613.1 uncharacterized protein LOC117856335 [Setaria viridis]